MKRRPLLLLAILVYISLDFSLPAMPGAFVFDSADSVETIQVNRSRADLAMAVSLPLARTSFISRLPAEPADACVLNRAVTPVVRPVSRHLPRATLRPAPPPEDPY